MSQEEEKDLTVTQPMPKGTDPPVETTTTAPPGDEPQTDAGIVQLASGLPVMFAIFVL